MIENLNKLNKIIQITKQLSLLLASFILLSACSGYKSSWDCPKAKGIGCSSLEYADEMAREQILLNTGKHKKPQQTMQGTKKGSQARQDFIHFN